MSLRYDFVLCLQTTTIMTTTIAAAAATMVESKLALQVTYCDGNSPEAVSLTSLPDELLLEIVDCLPRVSVLINRNMPYDEENLTRREVVSALSQTCRRFRSLLYPLLWQTIEAVASKYHFTNPAWPKN